MIEESTLHNFQGHKDTTIQFVNGVNMIIGSSDAGKSSIIRALRWVAKNRPSADSVRRHKTKQTFATIKKDGLLSTRIKSNKDNSYELVDKDTDESITLKAFGQGVPEEVLNTLELDDINFQFQQDPPFLLSNSSAENARYLNKITNLDIIDSSLSNAKKHKRKLDALLEEKQQSVDLLDKEIEDLEWIDDADYLLTKINLLKNKLSELRESKTSLNDILNRIIDAESKIKGLNELVHSESDLFDITSFWRQKQGIEQTYHNLVDFVSHIQGEYLFLAEYSAQVELSEDMETIADYFSKLETHSKNTDALFDLLDKISDLTEEKETFSSILKTSEAYLKSIMPDTCPICGSDLCETT